jgi:nucleoside 2-deoxyribosyltransferase
MAIKIKKKNIYTVYLAGPDVFRPDAVKAGQSKKEMIKRISQENDWPFTLEGLFPLDNEIPDFKNDRDTGLRIYQGNIELMDSADFIAANMVRFRGPSMDTGTAFEMGYMAASKKPVFAYHDAAPFYGEPEIKRTYANTIRLHHPEMTHSEDPLIDNNGLIIEDFGMHDNLMMIGALNNTQYNGIESSLEHVIQNIGDFIMSNLHKQHHVDNAFSNNNIDIKELFYEISPTRYHLDQIMTSSKLHNGDDGYITLLIGKNALDSAKAFINSIDKDDRKKAIKANAVLKEAFKDPNSYSDDWYKNGLTTLIPLFATLSSVTKNAYATPGHPFELSMSLSKYNQIMDAIELTENLFVKNLLPGESESEEEEDNVSFSP